MGSNADTATIGPNTSPEGFRGASTDDPDTLKEISSAVRSDLWWAEDECKGLEKEIPTYRVWSLIVVLLVILIVLTPIIFTDWLVPAESSLFPSSLLILYIVIFIALLFVLVGAVQSPKDLYEERHARVRELEAELEFVQDKIKRIEDAQ